MRKTLTQITLGVIAITTATSVLSIQFTSREAAAKHLAEERQRWQEKKARVITALGNDDNDALKKEIYTPSSLINTGGSKHEELQGFMRDCKIPPERVLKILEKTIREGLSVLEEIPDVWHGQPYNDVVIGVELLDALPESEETLALIKECLQSKNLHVRNRVENIVEWQTRKRRNALELALRTNTVQVVTPEPVQPSATTIPTTDSSSAVSPSNQTKQPNEIPDNAVSKDNEFQDEPVGEKSVLWQLPLLIAMLVIGGSVVTWRCFARKTL